MKEEMSVLIDLAAAHVTQYTEAGDTKTDWFVRQNITSKDLAVLPGRFTEEEVFKILDFAREFELIAFNVGIQFQKKLSDEHYQKLLDGHKRVIDELTTANDRLATKLEGLIGGHE